MPGVSQAKNRGKKNCQPEGLVRQMSSMNREEVCPTVCKASLVNDFSKSSAVYRGHIPYPPGRKDGQMTHARLYPLESIDPRDPGSGSGS